MKQESDKLARRDQLAIRDEKDLFKAVAMDIGKETAAYIEVMYPEAVKATSSTFLLSVRNHIHNQIMAAIEVDSAQDTVERLRKRAAFRRWWKAQYRKIRHEASVESQEPSK